MYGTRWGQLLGNRSRSVPGTSDQAWDPAVTEGPLVLSAHDLVITVETPGAAAGDGTYGVLSQSSGKVYWEVVFYADSGSSDPLPLNCGLIDSDGGAASFGLGGPHVVVAGADGSIYGNDVTIGGWVIPAQGDVICQYADLDAGRFYVRLNDSDWRGESGAGDIGDVTGADISYLGSDVFPYVDVRLDAGGSVVGKFSPSQWLYSPPAGAVHWVGSAPPVGGGQAWDPAFTEENIGLSDGNLVTTGLSGAAIGSSSRGVASVTSGLIYWEIEATATPGGSYNYAVGVCDSTFTTGSTGSANSCVAYGGDGTIYVNDGGSGSWTPPTEGGVVCCALDADTGVFRVRTGGGSWSSDVTLASLDGTFFPVVEIRLTDIILTAHFDSDAWVHTPESGYGPWTVAPVGYQGLGDIAPGAFYYSGMRAYDAASIGTDAIRVKRGDLEELDCPTIASGSLDTAAIEAFHLADTNVPATRLVQVTNYDQIGSLHVSGAPTYDPTGLGGTPVCLYDSFYDGGDVHLTTARSQPISVILVVRNDGTGAHGIICSGTPDGSAYGLHVMFGLLAANSLSLYGGGAAHETVTVSDDVFHSLQILLDGADSVVSIDGAAPVPFSGDPGSVGFLGKDFFGMDTGTTSVFQGAIAEMAFYEGDVVTANYAAIYANHSAYYGV